MAKFVFRTVPHCDCQLVELRSVKGLLGARDADDGPIWLGWVRFCSLFRFGMLRATHEQDEVGRLTAPS